MKIRLATLKDIKPVLEITRACAKHLMAQGIYMWNENYPTESAFINDVKRRELYVLEENNTLRGCIVLSTFMDLPYEKKRWLSPNKNNLYIHRLAVHPHFQGKGYAQQLMDFAENFADENLFASIRLDTFSQNFRNHKFYEVRGYIRLDEIYFPDQSPHPFYCYELVF